MRKIILLAATILIAVTQLLPYLGDYYQRLHILEATVLITITTPNWQQKQTTTLDALPIPSGEYWRMAKADGELVSEGMGSLVANGQETLLVTHDHWSNYDQPLGTVTFRDHTGAFIERLDLRTYQQHIRHRDGGTMVLTAPEPLTTRVKAEVIHLDAIELGERVFLVHQVNNRVELTEANIIAQAEKQQQPVLRLQSADNQSVVGGDSGGGVWINGRFAGTMWAAIMLENIDNGHRQPTDQSIAAISPIHN